VIDYRVGDVVTAWRRSRRHSVARRVEAPPFIALRSYLPAGHPDKAKEIGSEADPATFLEHAVGTHCRNGVGCSPRGDPSPSSSATRSLVVAARAATTPLGGLREGQEKFTGSAYEARQDTKTHKVRSAGGIGGGIPNLHGKVQGGVPGWPRPKCLALIPQAYALLLGVRDQRAH